MSLRQQVPERALSRSAVRSGLMQFASPT